MLIWSIEEEDCLGDLTLTTPSPDFFDTKERMIEFIFEIRPKVIWVAKKIVELDDLTFEMNQLNNSNQ